MPTARSARPGAVRRPVPPCTRRGACKCFQCGRIRVAEGETEAERHMASSRSACVPIGIRPAAAIAAAGDRRGCRRSRGRTRLHLRRRRSSLARALPAAITSSMRNAASTACSAATAPIGCRGGGISAHTHVNVHASVARHRTQSHIGRNASSRCRAPPPSTATDTLGSRSAMKDADAIARRNCAASAPASSTSSPSRPASATHNDRRPLGDRQVEATDHCGQPFDRAFREAADLNASARRDLDHAVAAVARRRT